MVQIDNLSDDADQISQIVLDDGSVVVFEFTFRPSGQRWQMDISYGDFQLNGITLCVHPNMLREFRQVLPFGVACLSADGFDPFDINDFTSGRIALYVLNASDVASLETSPFGVAA